MHFIQILYSYIYLKKVYLFNYLLINDNVKVFDCDNEIGKQKTIINFHINHRMLVNITVINVLYMHIMYTLKC